MSYPQDTTGLASEGPAPDALEAALTRALRRVDAPQGFAANLCDRAAATSATPERAKILAMPRRTAFLRRVPENAWMAGALAAMLALCTFLGAGLHLRHQRQQAALAQQQFETAMRVTDHALDHTRAQLQRAGIRLP